MQVYHFCILEFFKVFRDDLFCEAQSILQKTCLIALSRLVVVGLKSVACKYWTSSGFEVCTRILFTKFSNFCVSRGTSHIPVFLFLVPLIIFYPLLWIVIYFLSSVMVHPSSHKTPHDINGDVYILGKMWISLVCLFRPGRCSVDVCVESIVVPSASIDFISFSIIIGAIVGVACFARCIFAP